MQQFFVVCVIYYHLKVPICGIIDVIPLKGRCASHIYVQHYRTASHCIL